MWRGGGGGGETGGGLPLFFEEIRSVRYNFLLGKFTSLEEVSNFNTYVIINEQNPSQISAKFEHKDQQQKYPVKVTEPQSSFFYLFPNKENF